MVTEFPTVHEPQLHVTYSEILRPGEGLPHCKVVKWTSVVSWWSRSLFTTCDLKVEVQSSKGKPLPRSSNWRLLMDNGMQCWQGEGAILQARRRRRQF
eukprot:2755470-Amphidinium_carterae.1